MSKHRAVLCIDLRPRNPKNDPPIKRHHKDCYARRNHDVASQDMLWTEPMDADLTEAKGRELEKLTRLPYATGHCCEHLLAHSEPAAILSVG
jgi:hypothetical protein